MEKLIKTMPIIQTHLIIEPNWAEVTKKAKNLEHIWRCDLLATASPIIITGGTVLGLYSHIAQSEDQDPDSIPKLFKSTKGKGGKKSGRGKSKPQQQPQLLPSSPEEEINNYYHNENYRGNSRGHRPYRGHQGGRRPFRGSQQRGRGQQNRGQY